MPVPLEERAPLIHTGPFARVILAPLLLWGGVVGALWYARQPGVVCVTPMAWLLALWAGTQYVNLSGGVPNRLPLLAPALIGALLGLGEGILFFLVSSLGMPATSPTDAIKAFGLSLAILIVGVFACAGLCMFTAALRLRSYSR